MRLPNGERAVVDAAKLYNYCLSRDHPVGKHKARVFARVLGIHAEDAGVLMNALFRAAREMDAVAGRVVAHGQLYTVDARCESGGGRPGFGRLGSCVTTRISPD